MSDTCKHGSVRDRQMIFGMWNGPVSRCSCCGSHFVYSNSGSISADGRTSGRTWVPRDKCAHCGGKYVDF